MGNTIVSRTYGTLQKARRSARQASYFIKYNLQKARRSARKPPRNSMTSHFLICIIYFIIVLRNFTEFCLLASSNLHIFILKYC